MLQTEFDLGGDFMMVDASHNILDIPLARRGQNNLANAIGLEVS